MAGQLSVLDETPQVMRSTHHGSQVRELLAVYQEILDTVDDLPLVPMVLRKHRGRLHYLPRAKWPVRYFVVRHVRRTLADLSRCYGARAALGSGLPTWAGVGGGCRLGELRICRCVGGDSRPRPRYNT